MVLQLRVGPTNHRVNVGARLEHEHRVHPLLRPIECPDDGGLPHPRLLVEHAFDVFGKDVEPVGRDDHLFLAALDEQPALLVALANVSRMKPAVGVKHAVGFGLLALGAPRRRLSRATYS